MTRKTTFFLEGWSWFKFNSLGLALGTVLKLCGKRVKTESQKVIGEKLLGRAQKGLNKVKRHNILKTQYEHIKMYSKKMTDGAFFPTQIDKSE